jgi:hypothetical protein
MLPTGSDQLVEDLTPQRLETATHPRPAPADSEIRLVERPHQLTDLGALHLVIGRHRHDRSSRSALKSGHERRGFAKALRETDDDEILAALEHALQRGCNLRPRAIQHHDELV